MSRKIKETKPDPLLYLRSRAKYLRFTEIARDLDIDQSSFRKAVFGLKSSSGADMLIPKRCEDKLGEIVAYLKGEE